MHGHKRVKNLTTKEQIFCHLLSVCHRNRVMALRLSGIVYIHNIFHFAYWEECAYANARVAKLLDTMAANHAIKEGLCHLPKGKISLFSLLAANYAIKRELCHLPEQKISLFSLLESCRTFFIGLPTMRCRSPNLACFNEVTLCSVVISVWTMFHLQWPKHFWA